jgi:nucleotide-binding universal stress UspA family protein
MSAYRRILAAVDGSPASSKGLREAIRLARAERPELFIAVSCSAATPNRS